MSLSPSVRGAVSSQRDILASLIGDFLPYQCVLLHIILLILSIIFREAPVLSEKYLAVPTQPAGDPRVTVSPTD